MFVNILSIFAAKLLCKIIRFFSMGLKNQVFYAILHNAVARLFFMIPVLNLNEGNSRVIF